MADGSVRRIAAAFAYGDPGNCRDNGKSVPVLRNGLRVPVSKTFRDQVKGAGWLAA